MNDDYDDIDKGLVCDHVGAWESLRKMQEVNKAHAMNVGALSIKLIDTLSGKIVPADLEAYKVSPFVRTRAKGYVKTTNGLSDAFEVYSVGTYEFARQHPQAYEFIAAQDIAKTIGAKCRRTFEDTGGLLLYVEVTFSWCEDAHDKGELPAYTKCYDIGIGAQGVEPWA